MATRGRRHRAHNWADVRPLACANRKNERNDRPIDLAVFVLRLRQYSTMNVVTVPASRTPTCTGWGSPARNCSACQQLLRTVTGANPR
jgi:hypothetical protein